MHPLGSPLLYSEFVFLSCWTGRENVAEWGVERGWRGLSG